METNFTEEEQENLHNRNSYKKIKSKPEKCISPTFVREKSHGVFCLILQFKKLNKAVEDQKFKLWISQLLRPVSFISKLDKKDVY